MNEQVMPDQAGKTYNCGNRRGQEFSGKPDFFSGFPNDFGKKSGGEYGRFR